MQPLADSGLAEVFTDCILSAKNDDGTAAHLDMGRVCMPQGNDCVLEEGTLRDVCVSAKGMCFLQPNAH